ncbi:phospholipase A2 inhibitor gamma subunit B-like [Anolis sagrei]|uniref:phospholipase A2 inhibitor gamma subunit B-like n=1 Tax=Anolis sagrei TaxID=38937 RepID=UPI00351FA8BC
MKAILIFSLICVCISIIHGENNYITCASCDLGDTKCENCTGAACVTIHQLSGSSNGHYRGCSNQTLCEEVAFTLTPADKKQIQSSSACCATDLCNQNLTLSSPPVGTVENGVNCPVCENYNSLQVCQANTHLACRGAEQKCITLEGKTKDGKGNFTFQGCATENACKLMVDDLVPFKDKIYTLSKNATCTDRGTLAAISSPMVLFPVVVGFLLANVRS